MPLGDGFGQLIRPAGTTPLQSGVRVADPGIGEVLTGLGRAIEARVKPVLMDQAMAEGRAAGDAGQQLDVTPITDYDVALKRANETAYLARNDIDRDETIAALQQKYAADPEAFQLAALEAKAAQIKGARGSLAVAVEQSWDRAIGRTTSRLQSQKAERDLKNAKADIDLSLKQAGDFIQASARAGTLSSDEAQEAMEKFNRLIDEKAANPLWGFSEVDANAARIGLSVSVAALTAGKHAEDLFEAGVAKGLDANRAYAEARQGLLDAFDTDPSLKGLGLTERQAMLTASDNALNEALRIRKDLVYSEQQEAKAEEKARKDAQRETNESFERRLVGNPGAVTVEEIDKAVADGLLTSAQGNQLIRYRRSEADRVRVEQARADAMVRAAEATAQAAASTARSAAKTAFNQGSTAQREVLDLQANTNPDLAYKNFLARASVMTPQDRMATRNAIMQGYGQIDERIQGAMKRTAPSEVVGADYAMRYESWTQANPFASVAERKARANSILAGPSSSGLRQSTRGGGGRPPPASRPPPRSGSVPKQKVQ